MQKSLRNLLFCALAMVVPQVASALNLPTYPVNAIQDSGPNSFFLITFTGIGAGYDVVDNKPYLGWCAEQELTSANFAPTVTLYNTIDPATPTQGNLALPGGHAGHNWPKVNYVLNHKQGGVNDVQFVIWHYVNGVDPVSVPASAATAAMIADADAHGGAFVPGPGQVTAVLLYQDGYGNFAQDTLIEVQLPSNWCGLTWGFWKNHTNVWPVSSLVMGGKLYSFSELMAILGTPVRGDQSLNLAHQLIAAKLNFAMGVQVGVGTKISDADALLAAYPGKVPLGKAINNASAMTTAATALDQYNSDGLLQPGCTMRY